MITMLHDDGGDNGDCDDDKNGDHQYDGDDDDDKECDHQYDDDDDGDDDTSGR